MKKYLLLLFLSTILIISCTDRNFSIDNLFKHAYYNGHERTGVYQLDYNGWMCQYLMAYVNNYYEQPQDINFLIKAFDKVEDVELMRKVYAMQYQLMSAYKDDLKLYCTDSVTAIFYKSVKPANVVAITGYVNPEFDGFERMQICLYYDQEGYIVTKEELCLKYKKELYTIAQKYKEQGWQANDDPALYFKLEHKMFIVQYTSEQGLVNLDNNKQTIVTSTSAYFKEMEQWLKKTCEENDYSRMIISSLVPINNNI